MPLPFDQSANDYVAQNWPTGLPVDQPQQQPVEQPSVAQRVVDRLLGTNGQKRYQLWPERLVRDALSAPHDVMTGKIQMSDAEGNPSIEGTKAALDMSALAGTGGLAGAEASLGSGPFLRPALKYEGKIYKAPIGGQHLDALPPNLQDTFTKQAMNGDDISHFNFGFMNHKGQFLDREAALKYAIDQGLMSPHDAKFGALTSTMMADSSKEGAVIGALERSKSPFYSTLEKNVADISQNKMTGDQWLGTLANKPGVKPEEMDWTGLKDYLASKGKEAVSKDEVQKYVNDNAVKVGEVNKGELSDKDIMTQSKIRQEDWDKMSQSQKEVIRSGFPTNPTKFGRDNLVLPGGSNYQEKLLTLPNKSANLISKYGSFTGVMEKGTQAEKDFMQEEYSSAWKNEPQSYKSSHWAEPNVLAHIRTNDRDVGGVPSKHIEEMQSDWHQQGRDKGYQGEASDLIAKQKAGTIKPEEQNRLDSIISNGTSGGVPNAPFKKSWPELAMKRTIRQAIEEGKSRVSWTPGEAQAARYDLSKQVDKIAVPMVNKDGARSVRIDAKNDLPFKLMVNKDGIVEGHGASSSQFSGKPLSDVVGKKMAQKIMKLENPDEFSGDGLKIGGEGMKGFYDQMLPAMVEKIGKKYGVKVKQGTTETDNIIAGANKGGRIKDTVHYFDIPDKMKTDVLTKGFPLFSKGVPVIPNQENK